ncbi:dockerin type I domain-containing protein [Pseudobacteroides cellulosolvens]|uniref:Dockerin domain-containing protein n=1 Tax=Pseudobacteroides cellulosolvens ATCC 35603 = DSM 2933 TaxID=398512 RepID=A0A0L6JXS6_9FIRM|nr:dockerin type I domain-containing protein [Pseudobacteroides cellulosolvens]KNY30232.1 hypothetical protein Bccel_5509 [Pseudobacteroides cellulosolvens ATCC 35603 = DSM 2933]
MFKKTACYVISVIILCSLISFSCFLSFAADGQSTPIPTVRPTLLPGICEASIKPDFDFANNEVLKGFYIDGAMNAINDKGILFAPNSTNGLSPFTIHKEGYLSRHVELPIGKAKNPIEMWAGDINGDKRINIADIILMSSSFNMSYTASDQNIVSDFNKDKSVNMADVMIIARHFGATVNDYPEYKAY